MDFAFHTHGRERDVVLSLTLLRRLPLVEVPGVAVFDLSRPMLLKLPRLPKILPCRFSFVPSTTGVAPRASDNVRVRVGVLFCDCV